MKSVSLRSNVRGIAAALVLAGGLLSPAWASLETDMLARWYSLLERADADGLSGLLARSARIQLDDLGITQTKQEFLDSMDEWRSSMEGGSIRYQVETTSAGSATALVCYDFAANDLLARERFTFVNGLITRSRQTTVAEDCGNI